MRCSSDIEVRRKCLQIVLSLASNRNIAEIADVLKKELQKTYGQDYEKVLFPLRTMNGR